MSKTRRQFTPEFKLECVLDIISGRKRPVEICNEYQISDTLLSKWRQHFMENAANLFVAEQNHKNASNARIAELERLVGQLRAIACRISMTDRGKPWQNPYVESTIGRIKDEYIVDSEYQNFHDAYNQLSLVLDVVYNQKRPHSALGYRTPAEFEAAYNAH